jgi:hypothetical protein
MPLTERQQREEHLFLAGAVVINDEMRAASV